MFISGFIKTRNLKKDPRSYKFLLKHNHLSIWHMWPFYILWQVGVYTEILRIVIMPTLPSLAALEVIIMITTSSVTSDDEVGTMISLRFQYGTSISNSSNYIPQCSVGCNDLAIPESFLALTSYLIIVSIVNYQLLFLMQSASLTSNRGQRWLASYLVPVSPRYTHHSRLKSLDGYTALLLSKLHCNTVIIRPQNFVHITTAWLLGYVPKTWSTLMAIRRTNMWHWKN